MSNLRQRQTQTTRTEEETNGRRATNGQSNGLAREHIAVRQGLVARIIKKLAYLVIGVAIFLHVISPLVWYNVPFIRHLLVFMNYMNLAHKDLTHPAAFGLNCTRTFYIERQANPERDEEHIRLGAWHILPASRLDACSVKQDEEAKRTDFMIDDSVAFKDDHLVVLYLHGNGGARGGNHRVNLYKVLAYSPKVNVHVLTIDYRGYGDSSDRWPSRDKMTQDATLAYQWLLTTAGVAPERIIVWGHSLGTAIGVRFVSQLSAQQLPHPAGMVLEAPFNSIADAFRTHPMSAPFRLSPYFEEWFVSPVINSAETNFNTNDLIGDVKCPILIMHAADDQVLPIDLGHKLYTAAVRSRQSPEPSSSKTSHSHQMLTFDGKLGYGHKHIHRDPQLPDHLNHFLRKIRTSQSQTQAKPANQPQQTYSD